MRGNMRSVARGVRSSRALFPGLLLAFALWAPASAGASIGPKLVEFGEVGGGAGQISTPQGIAADPDTGHLFLADTSNDRISEFTAWGEFVKSWGWGVADGSAELQTCTSTCQEGIAGTGAGQLNRPGGIAVAENGDVYVFERANHRVQVFSPAGGFLRMFGGGVDHTTGADICTAADLAGGDECGAGSEGTGPSEFSMPPLTATGRDYLDIDSSGTVYVGDRDRIQEFEPDGTFKTSIPLPNPGNPGGLSVDPSSGDLYFAYGGELKKPFEAVRLSPSGSLLYPLPEEEAGEEGAWAPTALAADPDGNVFLAQEEAQVSGEIEGHPRVLEIDPTGAIADSCCELPLNGESGADYGEFPAVTTNVVTAGGGVDLYILYKRAHETYVEVRGPGPDKWPPPPNPPEVVGQFAAAVGVDAASIKAEINPKFWDDTHYYLEYGTAECRLGGCAKTPVPPGFLLDSGIVSVPVISEAIELSGLTQGTTYHYRFVAVSGGGGPVYGEDPDGAGPEEASFEDGRERTFTTYAPEPEAPICPNQAFRTGPGAKLPDCRAYEMVSPLEKFGGDVLVQLTSLNLPAKLEQAAPDGDKLTYTSYRAFADPASALYQSQYLATRTAGGWATANISPPKEGPSFVGLSSLDVPYEGFLPDLSAGWVRQLSEPVLAPGGVPGYPNLYKNTFGSGYAAVTTAEPSNTAASSYALDVQGFSADGRRVVFAANGKLTANASTSTNPQVYESFEGALRLVSVKPNGVAAAVGASAGSRQNSLEGRNANVTHAMSADGSRIYWSEGENAGKGKVYVRVGGTKTTQVSAGNATFWAATPSGSKAIYTEESGALELFDLTSASSTTLASSVEGVVGESEDLSRVYFVSTAALATGAEAGRPNLYLYEAGQPTALVAVLAAQDTPNAPLSADSLSPWRRVSRVTPDGSAVIFMSRGSLAGADTKDAASGAADAEVYRWDVSERELRCVSCPPSGARP
ncbi:MAG TPA: NHL repeat-containing protein, partial [Solirubrobacterales bacterium]|nr:NHL repeat-containing protein [Solirubrobacterales bacterium]